MKKLALLFLVLPLAACATAPKPISVSQNCSSFMTDGEVHPTCAQDSDISGPNIDPLSITHWKVATGFGAFLPSPGDQGGTAGPYSYSYSNVVGH
jgi:hypothetical protein